jgi:hypothetical protein
MHLPRHRNLVRRRGDGDEVAPYYEFSEIGLIERLAYHSASGLIDRYPQLYWNKVSPHIQDIIRDLNMTSSGRRWVAGPYNNVFHAERDLRHSGPRP